MASSTFTSQPFLYHLLSRNHQFSPCSKVPPSQPPNPSSQTPPLNSTSFENPIKPKVQETISNNKKLGKSGGLTVETTDWIASSLTRRFGLSAGLAWAGFLAFGVLSEQIKTRIEVSREQTNTRDLEKVEEVILPNGIRYYEMRVGGGASPRTGDLLVVDLKGSIKDTGEVFVDTFGEKNKSLALVMGSRPYTKGMCDGLEYIMKTMKAGGKRRVIIPPNFGYGDNGTDFGSGVIVPPRAILEYIVEVDKVSIAPT